MINNEKYEALNAQSIAITTEADELLYKRGLLAALQKYGTVHITGSYYLNLMAWRDLDLYIDSSKFSESDFFLLGNDIANAVQAGKMHYRNEFILQSGLPQGKYWGTYTDIIAPHNWKIDLWAINSELCEQYMAFAANLKAQVNDENRMKILDIKSQVWMHPDYRKEFTSMDIYHAVFNGGVGDIDEFKLWVKANKGFEF
jgi:hypothetical protein